MRPIPATIDVPSASIAVVTDPEIVDRELEKNDLGEAIIFRREIVLRTQDVGPGVQWKTLIHELWEFADTDMELHLSHQKRTLLEMYWFHVLLRNGFLER